MIITVNGKPRQVEQPGSTPLVEVLTALGLDPTTVAVEVNGAFLPRTEMASTRIQEGDRLEVVRMVCGG